MKIIGYTYEADYHCVACTKKRFRNPETAHSVMSDINGIHLDTADSEGNQVRSVYVDELPSDIADEDGGYSPVVCGDCGAVIKKQPPKKQKQIRGPLDLTGDIIAYESGEFDEEQTIQLFQNLIDTGLAWQLQGSYGRTAAALIRRGVCTPKATV